MKILFLSILSALALTACAGQEQWKKPGATATQAKATLMQCEYDAMKATAACGDPLGCGGEKYDLRHACMQLQGFKL